VNDGFICLDTPHCIHNAESSVERQLDGSMQQRPATTQSQKKRPYRSKAALNFDIVATQSLHGNVANRSVGVAEPLRVELDEVQIDLAKPRERDRRGSAGLFQNADFAVENHDELANNLVLAGVVAPSSNRIHRLDLHDFRFSGFCRGSAEQIVRAVVSRGRISGWFSRVGGGAEQIVRGGFRSRSRIAKQVVRGGGRLIGRSGGRCVSRCAEQIIGAVVGWSRRCWIAKKIIGCGRIGWIGCRCWKIVGCRCVGWIGCRCWIAKKIVGCRRVGWVGCRSGWIAEKIIGCRRVGWIGCRRWITEKIIGCRRVGRIGCRSGWIAEQVVCWSCRRIGWRIARVAEQIIGGVVFRHLLRIGCAEQIFGRVILRHLFRIRGTEQVVRRCGLSGLRRVGRSRIAK
jgi:hypothetical protein